MVAFLAIKKPSKQQVLYMRSGMSVAVHKEPSSSVEFVSLFNGLCPLQTGRFDICVKPWLADPGYVIYPGNCPTT